MITDNSEPDRGSAARVNHGVPVGTVGPERATRSVVKDMKRLPLTRKNSTSNKGKQDEEKQPHTHDQDKKNKPKDLALPFLLGATI